MLNGKKAGSMKIIILKIFSKNLITGGMSFQKRFA
jgi:hypothetical protein